MPSARWFPRPLQDRAAWYANFSHTFSLLARQLGLTPEDAEAVNKDNAMIQWLAEADVAYQSSINAYREFRDMMLDSPTGSSNPQFPQVMLPANPELVSVGLLERLDRLVARVKASPTYTEDTGQQLGIVGSDTETPPPPDTLKPALKVKAQPGSKVETTFVRGPANGISLEYQRASETAWTPAGTYLVSPAETVIAPLTPNTPEVVRLRARYIQGNNAVGQHSDIVVVTTQP